MILKQGASLLLILLFLSLAAAPVLHEHKEAHVSHQEKDGTQEQLQLSDKCSVCDYYHHIQGKQLFSYDQLELPAIFSKVITTSPHLLTGNYKITVQGFTNKGPPQIS